MKNINWRLFITFILLTFGTGALSTLFSSMATAQYSAMYQPPFSPPSWVFPIVWNILFLIISISVYLTYTVAPKSNGIKILYLYILQLIFVFGWTIFFFRFDLYIFAFFWLCALWLLIVIMILAFKNYSRLASQLLYPYLIWVTFAGYLNYTTALYYK